MHGLKKYNELEKYVRIADIMLISLKKGKTFDSTIPGKFSTYINYNKFIFGIIGGETNYLINKYKIGYATDSQDPIKIKEKLENLLNKNLKIDEKNFIFLKKIFSKNLAIQKLNKILGSLYEKEKTQLLKNIGDINFKKNIILSALNLAFLGYYAKGEIKLKKEFVLWPDGYFASEFGKNIEKIPGRELLQNIKLNKTINKIIVFGNMSIKGKEYLKNKFNLEIEHIILPYGNILQFKKYIPKLNGDELILITLPTPKQEIMANLISEKNIYFKILCIGGALSMITKEEKPIPKFFDIFFFSETLWRLQYDTLRRLKRLFQSLIYYFYGKIFRIFKNLKIEILNEK